MSNCVSLGLGRKALLGIISEVAARVKQEKHVHTRNSTVCYRKLSCGTSSQKAQSLLCSRTQRSEQSDCTFPEP